MYPVRDVFAFLVLLFVGGCAATPGEELGSIPPRSPVTPQEQEKIYPIDVWDPLEGFNRGVYRFNTQFDRWVFLPVVHGYEYVTPDPVERGVSNFFSNLSELRNGWNGALQGRGDVFGTALGRLMINSTLGVVGLFDPATALGYPQRPEDFGQTLGRWGFADGPFIMLPFLGPSTVRDTVGWGVDILTDPVTYVDGSNARYGIRAVSIVQRRSELLDATKILDAIALDEYQFLRDAYLQRRRSLVYDGKPPPNPEDLLPPI